MHMHGAAMDNEVYSVDNPLSLEDTIVYRIAVATNVNTSLWQRRYGKRFDLTITDWRVLMLLASHPGMSAVEVSETLAVDKMTITRSVKRLLARKCIRARTNPGDRRRLALTIAPAGAAIYNEVAPEALSYQEHLLQDLSAAERLMLRDLLGKLLVAGRRMANADSAS